MATKRKRKKKGRYHRGDYTSTKSGQVFKYRSGWEAKYMAHLDADPAVESWSYEQIVIEYISNIRTKKYRKYYPDFYVRYSDGRTEIVELKQKRKLEQLNVKKKTTAALVWCAANRMTYRLLTEVELKEMGIL